MGVYCAIATIQTTGEENAILAACRGSNCTPQCRNLLTNIQNELGCCINVILNNYYIPPAYYSLWASCGVELVRNDCMSTLIQRSISIDPNCTSLSWGLFTAPLATILEALTNENDSEIYSQVIHELCGVNEAGVPCYAVDATAVFVNARSVCNTSTSCKDLLSRI